MNIEQKAGTIFSQKEERNIESANGRRGEVTQTILSARFNPSTV
jgi:hypothetical protein